jgi:catechol 2,3-dioxygenase-like lactoylglutathione lyase family enzyme
MMEVYKISAVTLIITNMKKSCDFYRRIPGFRLIYGGEFSDSFTTFEIGESTPNMCLNLELAVSDTRINHDDKHNTKNFGRIIFHTNDVDKLYSYFKSDEIISSSITFEYEPTDATWGERYFHIREPDGYSLSFSQPIKN